ncbi:hypothetical protein [Candidatus Liberibacter americanus]|uniref:Tyr recombinase domain-containing protein n=1 Tax=Candidatus Liberibacter americanus str. Sao Paulo TaxID=1261131 RepID=U6B4B1_9HYPH|nr:hypothetical protein [Candidatus Liberibacter americanus]AHA27904.1 hypothetical protein lam_554 [Candidatus Liberibacter americanus str. Sao Paulo]EMS36097.1 integrase family protein [Candidatus Liberibacter americanus PW_SP]
MSRLVLELILFLGLRRFDLIRIGKKHVKDNILYISTKKTGTTVNVPIFEYFQKYLDTVGKNQDTFLINTHECHFSSSGSFGKSV